MYSTQCMLWLLSHAAPRSPHKYLGGLIALTCCANYITISGQRACNLRMDVCCCMLQPPHLVDFPQVTAVGSNENLPTARMDVNGPERCRHGICWVLQLWQNNRSDRVELD